MTLRALHLSLLFATLPIVASAQYSDVSSMVEAYSNLKRVSHTRVGKAMVWMAKAGAPKGAMDGVESIDILKFDDGASSADYIRFRASADSLFAVLGAECVMEEPNKKGSTEVYMERKANPTEYMTYMFTTKDNGVTFMRMAGELPSSL